jgi:hypothetical protein
VYLARSGNSHQQGADEHWRPNVSPSDSNDVIGEYADANVLQTEIAAAAAREVTTVGAT